MINKKYEMTIINTIDRLFGLFLIEILVIDLYKQLPINKSILLRQIPNTYIQKYNIEFK